MKDFDVFMKENMEKVVKCHQDHFVNQLSVRYLVVFIKDLYNAYSDGYKEAKTELLENMLVDKDGAEDEDDCI